MALEVQMKHPTQGPDEEFAIPGVGMVKNGSTVTLDAEQEAMAFAMTGMHIKDYFKDSEMVTVTGTAEAKLPANTVPEPNVNPDTVSDDEGSDK